MRRQLIGEGAAGPADERAAEGGGLVDAHRHPAARRENVGQDGGRDSPFSMAAPTPWKIRSTMSQMRRHGPTSRYAQQQRE